jgi:hypothetical protein
MKVQRYYLIPQEHRFLLSNLANFILAMQYFHLLLISIIIDNY